MRLSRKKILALCMSGALVLASIPGMYVKSVAAKKNNLPVIRLNTTSIKRWFLLRQRVLSRL